MLVSMRQAIANEHAAHNEVSLCARRDDDSKFYSQAMLEERL